MPKTLDALRKHLHVFVILAILIAVMTFPTIEYVFNTEVFWLPTGNHPDTWHKFWDAWYGKRILAGQADFYYTDLLFYPQGASLVYHNFSIPHMVAFGGLQALMPASNAYSLTFLLIIAAVTCSAYVYMLYLFKDKWIALLGAVIIGLSPHVVGYPEHPEYRFIATVPLALYFLHRGLAERRKKLVFYAAALTGLTAYVGMHVSVCLVVLLCMYWLYFLASSWRETSYWIAVGLFLATAALISAPRVVPMLENAQALGEALGSEGEINNDLLEYFVNPRHPLTKLLLPHQSFDWGFGELSTRYSSYLGYTVLFLAGIGLVNKSDRRLMLPWLAMALPFLLLRLGSVLTIDGVSYSQVLLPKHYLDELVPAITEGFRRAEGFHLGTLVPLAVLACLGASALLQRVRSVRRPLIILVVVGAVCFEYYQPVRPGVVRKEELAFLDWLEDEGVEVRLVNLPMNIWSSKYLYSFHQTQKGYPHADGAIARSRSDDLAYIKGNHLLSEWKVGRAATCTWQTRDQYLPALEQLAADGFTHVVLHKNFGIDRNTTIGFVGVEASYADDFVSIYRVNDLRRSCNLDTMTQFFSAFPYADIYLMPSIIHERNGLVMSLHQSQSAHEAFKNYFSHITFDRKDMVHIHYDHLGEPVIQSSDYLLAYFENITGSYNGIWLINDPQVTDLSQMPVVHDWLELNYTFCSRYLDLADATIDLYLKHGIPCKALSDQSRYEALYDSGAKLHNVSYDLTANRVTFYFVWTITPERNYAFSTQFFDEMGHKALQYDSAIFHDAVTVHGVDISRLQAGAYDVKLIVYDPETGLSESGIVVEGEKRFDRFLDIGTIEVG